MSHSNALRPEPLKNVTAFLPCRAGSERVPKKNIKPFAGVNGGLLQIKLTQLANCQEIQAIIVSTDDPEIIAFTNAFQATLNKPIHIVQRPQHLAESTTSTDALIEYVPSIITEQTTILWTHVTSPFIETRHYSQAIHYYFTHLHNGYDSLMSVTALHEFIWNKEQPVNYDLNTEKWPRTQTLEPLYQVNSGIFIASRDVYVKEKNRIGKHPFLMMMDRIEAFDIDWEIDYELAEYIMKEKWAKQETGCQS